MLYSALGLSTPSMPNATSLSRCRCVEAEWWYCTGSVSMTRIQEPQWWCCRTQIDSCTAQKGATTRSTCTPPAVPRGGQARILLRPKLSVCMCHTVRTRARTTKMEGKKEREGRKAGQRKWFRWVIFSWSTSRKVTEYRYTTLHGRRGYTHNFQIEMVKVWLKWLKCCKRNKQPCNQVWENK